MTTPPVIETRAPEEAILAMLETPPSVKIDRNLVIDSYLITPREDVDTSVQTIEVKVEGLSGLPLVSVRYRNEMETENQFVIGPDGLRYRGGIGIEKHTLDGILGFVYEGFSNMSNWLDLDYETRERYREKIRGYIDNKKGKKIGALRNQRRCLDTVLGLLRECYGFE